MDNVNFDVGPRLRALIEGAGCVLAYLPTYSPDLNAIGEAISKIKQGLRRLKPRDEGALESGLVQVLKACLRRMFGLGLVRLVIGWEREKLWFPNQT